MSSDRLMLMVHGAGPQPEADVLQEHWVAALRRGVERDHSKRLKAFDAAQKSMYHYASERESDVAQTDRREALNALLALERTKDFKRREYESVPGKSALREFAMDLSAPIASAVGLGARLEALQLPELMAYWDGEAGMRAAAQGLSDWLAGHLARDTARDTKVLLITHCFGTVLAYDALSQREGAVDMLLTLGSPLASNAVRKRLAGRGSGDYPGVNHWLNVAAEDDPVCHDKSVADDFRAMTQSGSRIEDRVIYNLATRGGRSAPHRSMGYLVHPAVASAVAEWLR